MHNKRIINDVWWALLHEGVPVRKTTTDHLAVDSEYIDGECLLTSGSFIWLNPIEDTAQFFTDAVTTFSVKEEIDPEKLRKAVLNLGEYWAEWSSERNIDVNYEYLQDRMRECICDTLNERGVPAKLFYSGKCVAVHDCTLVSYDSCYFDVSDFVTCKEGVNTSADNLICLCKDNMDAIVRSLVDFAERYAALPSEENVKTAEHTALEPMKDVVARLGETLDGDHNYRKACAKCLKVISEGLENNPDDTYLWRLHTMFVNSMKEIAYGTHE